jgi:hypothetical protein
VTLNFHKNVCAGLLTLSALFVIGCGGPVNPKAGTTGKHFGAGPITVMDAQGEAGIDPQFNCQEMAIEACKAFQLVNAQRRAVGARSLELSSSCVAMAAEQSAEMAQTKQLGHERAGETFKARAARFEVDGFWFSELVDQSSSAKETVKAWSQNPENLSAILNRNHISGGVGFADGYFTLCLTSLQAD